MKQIGLFILAVLGLAGIMFSVLVWGTGNEAFEPQNANVREPIVARDVTVRNEVPPPPPSTKTQTEKEEEDALPETVRFSVRINPVIADGPPPEDYQVPEFNKNNQE